MPRHVALIGEARLESDLRKGQRASAQKRHRPLDAGEHDVAMRRMSRRAGEGPAEMERAEAGDVGHCLDADVAVQIVVDIAERARQGGRTERARRWRTMPCVSAD